MIAREIEVEDVGAVTARERPDVALVGLGRELGARARADRQDRAGGRLPGDRAASTRAIPQFVKEASKRGVFAHISDADVEDWQSSIDIVLRRFAEYHDLEGAFGRRALTERAKGILMERHAIDETRAFEMLREHSRADNRKLVDLAAAVVDGRPLLPEAAAAGPGRVRTALAPGYRLAVPVKVSRSAPLPDSDTALIRPPPLSPSKRTRPFTTFRSADPGNTVRLRDQGGGPTGARTAALSASASVDAWHRARPVDEPVKDGEERSSDDRVGEQDREWLADAVSVEVDRVSQE